MKKPGILRIIGGQWKSRQIRFPNLPGLRPSPDAVRETLFNWLQYDLPGSVCLDLYAGSGVFGLEAVSRGANRAVLVESDRVAVKHLIETRNNFSATDQIEIYHGKALDFLTATTRKFDIVFIDPPFSELLLEETFRALLGHDCLDQSVKIYVESEKSNSPLSIPSSWHIIRESLCGMVQSTLIETEHRK